jgi:hypothetical protein
MLFFYKVPNSDIAFIGFATGRSIFLHTIRQAHSSKHVFEAFFKIITFSMMRLFEFEDLEWFPVSIRECMTDYLRFVLNGVNFYSPVSPILKKGLAHARRFALVDLCSGGGGAIEKVQLNFMEAYKFSLPVTLTDKFPNLPAYHLLSSNSNGNIGFNEMPVDAMHVPPELSGLRTMFSAFHHFNKLQAKAILADAVQAKDPIAIFDGGDKNIFTILGMLLVHPLVFIFFTPFFTPFKWSRIVFTYLLPLIPICTIWDGIVSVLRLYHPAALLKIAGELSDKSYNWEAGNLKNKFGMNVTYLLGYPIQGST